MKLLKRLIHWREYREYKQYLRLLKAYDLFVYSILKEDRKVQEEKENQILCEVKDILENKL